MGLLSREQTLDFVKDWIDDLLSNADKQGKHCLEKDGKFCCLGRAALLAQRYLPGIQRTLERTTGVNCNRVWYEYREDSDASYLPESLAEDLGINCNGSYHDRYGNVHFLTDDNDRGGSFKEIAQIIEQHKEELFPLLAQ